jgi:Amino acid transporters
MMSDNNKGPTSSGGVEQFGYKQELKRSMTLKDVVLYGILYMVVVAPMSIFGIVQKSSNGMTPLVYIVGGICISFTAMSYMRMSNKFPIAGSVYAYVQRGINPHVGFIAGWLILLDYLFIPALIYVVVANWGVALVPNSPWFVWILVFMLFNTFVNIRGINMTKGLDWVLFIVECVALVAFLVIGLSFVFRGGGTGHLSLDPIYQAGHVNLSFIASACSVACLSFLGFDGMSTMAEETIEPEKNIGKGILIALIFMVGVFVLQTYVASLVDPNWQNMDENLAFFNCAYLAGGKGLQYLLLIVNIIASGIANNLTAQAATSRMLYGMGRDGMMPKFFAKIHPKYQTPYLGIIFVGIFASGIACLLTLDQLSRLVNFGALSSFVLLNIAVFVYFFVREKQRNGFGSIMKYCICPWLGVLILLYVFTGFDKITYIVGFSWLIIGIVVGAIKSKGYKEVPDAFKHLEV